MSAPPFDLYLITPSVGAPGLLDAAARALEATEGRCALQLRDKSADTLDLVAAGRALVALARPFGAPVLVSGRADVALAIGADGVHLPETGMSVSEARALLGPGAIVAVSIHDEAGLARAAGAGVAVAAPFAETPGKGPPLGPGGLARLCARARVPVLALGGIGPAQVQSALSAGAAGVAVVRAVFAVPDPAAAARGLRRALDSARSTGR